MTDPEFQVKISKDGSLVVVDPATRGALANIPFSGTIMKGCAGGTTLALQELDGVGGIRQLKQFETIFSFGNFSSPSVPGIINMQQNPSLKDLGYEIDVIPGQSYPKRQYWSMFGIFTVDLSGLDPKYSRFQLANKAENPIRLTVELQREWGKDPLRYEMIDNEVPLYPWDADSFDYSTICPLTGGAPVPIAFIKKDGDHTQMVSAWKRMSGALVRMF